MERSHTPNSFDYSLPSKNHTHNSMRTSSLLNDMQKIQGEDGRRTRRRRRSFPSPQPTLSTPISPAPSALILIISMSSQHANCIATRHHCIYPPSFFCAVSLVMFASHPILDAVVLLRAFPDFSFFTLVPARPVLGPFHAPGPCLSFIFCIEFHTSVICHFILSI